MARAYVQQQSEASKWIEIDPMTLEDYRQHYIRFSTHASTMRKRVLPLRTQFRYWLRNGAITEPLQFEEKAGLWTDGWLHFDESGRCTRSAHYDIVEQFEVRLLTPEPPKRRAAVDVLLLAIAVGYVGGILTAWVVQ